MSTSYVLRLRCIDRPGIVAAISALLFEGGGNITEAQQFDDPTTGQFFMRVAFDLEDGDAAIRNLRERIAVPAERFGLEWQVRAAAEKRRAVVLVSKLDHCLADLLYRTGVGDMNMDIAAIVSNHPLESLSLLSVGKIPYHHLPVTKETKPQQEAAIRRIIDDTGAELVILARYMQILSNDFSRYLEGRCINIHHSFLPGFKGAQPYHQAFARGVKIIGATAHYVTGDLDEGPIIEQDIVAVNHGDTPETLTRKGRDVERRVLSRAVIWHLQDRVLINGNKTVVFRS